MPVTMKGSPPSTISQVSLNGPAHWKEDLDVTFFNRGASSRHSIDALLSKKALRDKREAEFKERQKERMRKEAAEAEYEKQKRAEMTAKLEKRLEFQPGYGPTRWMWPTAAKFPRVYRPAGDIHVDPADLCFTGGHSGGTNGTPLHDPFDGHDIDERPGVERGPVGPMNPPWATSPAPPGSALMLSSNDVGRAGFAASTRSSASRSPTGSPESPL